MHLVTIHFLAWIVSYVAVTESKGTLERWKNSKFAAIGSKVRAYNFWETRKRQERAKQAINLQERVRQAIETQERVKKALKPQERVRQVIETQERVNKALKPHERVRQAIETQERVKEAITIQERKNKAIIFQDRRKNSRGFQERVKQAEKRVKSERAKQTKNSKEGGKTGDERKPAQPRTIMVQHVPEHTSLTLGSPLDKIDGNTWTLALQTPSDMAENVFTFFSSFGSASAIVATAISALILPFQIANQVLAIIAIAMLIAYVSGFGILDQAAVRNASVDDDFSDPGLAAAKHFRGGVLGRHDIIQGISDDFHQPAYAEDSRRANAFSTLVQNIKGDASHVWKTTFESARSFSNSPFTNDVYALATHIFMKYSGIS